MSPKGKPEGKKGTTPRRQDRQPSEGFNGLCRDCKDRFTCSDAKPLGGVWHCEKYR